MSKNKFTSTNNLLSFNANINTALHPLKMALTMSTKTLSPLRHLLN